MWKIIKAELSYNRIYLASAYLATIGMWVAFVFDPAGMFQLFGVPSFFLMAAVYHFGIKERRERFLALLPVTIKHRSLAFTLPFAIHFHVAVLAAWLTQFLRARVELANEYIPLSGVLTLGGITICTVLIVGIRFSLNLSKRKQRWMANVVMWIFIICIVLLFFLFKISFDLNAAFYVFIRNFIFHTPPVAVTINLVGAGLIFVSTIVYARRKSFLA
jgi:hypothetical protein